MALTKVRLPVADIAAISNGTSDITIGSAGGDIVVTRGGTIVVTHGTTGSTYGAGLTLVVDNINSEVLQLGTASGAEATFQTTLSQAEIETTNAFPLVLGANSIDALTIATDGKVELAVDGTAANHLVDKGYVDGLIATVPLLADTVFSATSPGSLVIPTDGDDFIINWGITASLTEASEAVVFDTAFPNAALGAMATRIASHNRSDAAHANTVTTTGMNVSQSGGHAAQVYWIAYGY